MVLVADHFFAGQSIYIDHGMGVITRYFHLSSISVSEGEKVAAGQTIGLAGATGRASEQFSIEYRSLLDLSSASIKHFSKAATACRQALQP